MLIVYPIVVNCLYPIVLLYLSIRMAYQSKMKLYDVEHSNFVSKTISASELRDLQQEIADLEAQCMLCVTISLQLKLCSVLLFPFISSYYLY